MSGRAWLRSSPAAEPPDEHQPVVLRIAQPAGAAVAEHLVGHLRIDAERQPELRRHERHRSGKAFRRHTDNRVVAPVESLGSPEHVLWREPRLAGELVSHNHDAHVALGPLFVRCELASRRQAHTERREVRRRRDGRERTARRVSVLRADHGDRVRHDRVERRPIRPNLLVVAPREAAKTVRPRSVATVDTDDAGAFGGHRLEHEGIDQAEDCGVSANAERQDQHGNRRESRVFQQEAGGMPDVLKHRHMDGFRGGLVPAVHRPGE